MVVVAVVVPPYHILVHLMQFFMRRSNRLPSGSPAINPAPCSVAEMWKVSQSANCKRIIVHISTIWYCGTTNEAL